MNGMQRLAEAERDAVELHKALSVAIQRMSQANVSGGVSHIEYSDLLEVLDRTAQWNEVPTA